MREQLIALLDEHSLAIHKEKILQGLLVLIKDTDPHGTYFAIAPAQVIEKLKPWLDDLGVPYSHGEDPTNLTVTLP